MKGKKMHEMSMEYCCDHHSNMGKWMGAFYIIGGLVAVGYYLGRIDFQTAAGLLGLGLLAKGIWKLSSMGGM